MGKCCLKYTDSMEFLLGKFYKNSIHVEINDMISMHCVFIKGILVKPTDFLHFFSQSIIPSILSNLKTSHDLYAPDAL